MKCVMLDWNERDQYRPMALNKPMALKKYIFTDTKIQKKYRCTWKHRLVCIHRHMYKRASQAVLLAKKLSTDAGDPSSTPGSGRGHGRQPTPAFLPGESHGQRSLVGYSAQGHTESDV